jgi:hypothetical protein
LAIGPEGVLESNIDIAFNLVLKRVKVVI